MSLPRYRKLITYHLNQHFGLSQAGSSLLTEFLAALCLFLTIAPTFAIYPFILESVGIPAENALLAYCITLSLSSLLMGFLTNLPLVIAPTYALTSLFAYGLIRDGGLSIEHALGTSFIVASLFLLLTLTPVRRAFLEALPPVLQQAFKAALGAWLFFFGLRMIGLSVSHPTNLLALGNISDPAILLAAVSLFFTFSLWQYRANWSFICAFSVSVLLAFFLNLLPEPVRDINFDNPVFYAFKLDLKYVIQAEEYLTPILLILMIIFVESAVLITAAKRLIDHQHTAKNNQTSADKPQKKTKTRGRAMILVAASNIMTSVLGAGPVVMSLNSLIANVIGGRTGLVAVFVGILSLLMIPLLPLFSHIPAFAVAALFMATGLFMLVQKDALTTNAPFEEKLIFWICVLSVLLVGSLTSGIGLSIILYVCLYLGMGKIRQINWGVWFLFLLFLARFLWL